MRVLSGRENVILGGLASGMTLEEVRSKQDEIIEFADIGDFIDLPTTTYSSGMFGRLAFAVATHAKTTILLVDEALSAGDTAFRRKGSGTNSWFSFLYQDNNCCFSFVCFGF